MGAGTALFSKNKDKKFSLRNLDEIGKEINLDHPYQFSEKEKETLQLVLNEINRSDIEKGEKVKNINKIIPAWKGNNEKTEDNKFGFTLSDDQITGMAKKQWDKHNDIANQRIAKIAQNNGWTAQEAEQIVQSMQGSKEQAAFTSLAYNGVRAPKMTAAWLKGDRVTARQELLYRSNSNSVAGLAARRLAEANLLTGDPATWSEEERARWEALEQSTEAQEYRARYPKTFPPSPNKEPSSTKPNGDTQGKTDEKNKEQNKDNPAPQESTDKNKAAPLSTEARSTLLTGPQPSPQSLDQQAKLDPAQQKLAALYPTMYPNYKPAPPPPPSSAELERKEQELKRLKALYPTMFPTEIA